MTSGLAQPALLEHPAHPDHDARAAEPLPPGSRAAVDRALRIVVLVWTGAWIPLMAFLEIDSESPTSPLTAAMLAALMLGWVVVAVGRLPVNGWYVAALAGTATVQALLTSPEDVWVNSGLIVTWTNLATLSAGFAIAGLRGRLAVAAIAGTQLVILTGNAWREDVWAIAWPGVVAASAYALADGMAAHVASSALRRQARDTDEAAEQLARRTRGLAAREARRRETDRLSRLLHDTVLNTLGAIRRGVEPSELDAVRSRCAQDLVVLHRLQAEVGEALTAAGLLRVLEDRAAGLSLLLETRARIGSPDATPDTIPAAVVDAVTGACSEAFLNVVKHSGVRTATLDLAWDGAGLDVRVHDDGRGWSGELPADRGIARSILGRARDAGVTALVATAPGEGTTVSLEWHADAPVDAPVGARNGAPVGARNEPPADPADPALARALARVAVLAGGWVAGLMVFLTLVFWRLVPSPASVLALAILGGVLLLSREFGVRRGRVPLPSWLALLLVVATFLVTALPARSALTCDQVAEGWWGLDGAVVVLLSLVLLTRGWWWSVLGAVAMIAGASSLYLRDVPLPSECADIPLVTSALELSIVLAVLVCREALLRLWERAEDARADAERLRTSEVVRDATLRARDARVDGVLASAAPMLDGISRGTLDPTAPAVQAQCASLEAALRALLTIGPQHDWLGDALAEAVLHAHATGRTVEVMPSSSAGTLPAAPAPAGAALRTLLLGLVDAMPAGGLATAALITGPDGASLTVVSDGQLRPVDSELGRELARDGLELEASQMGDQCLVEVRWT